MFPNFYKLIFAVILCISDRGITSIGNSSHKDLTSLSDDYFDRFLSSELSRLKRQLNNNEQFCEIPKEALHTRYSLLETSAASYQPGDYAPKASVLEVHCDEGYNLTSPFAQKYSICVNGNWNPLPTTCSRSCPSLSSTDSTTVKCSHEGIPLRNCLNPVEKTRATLSCTPFYDEASLRRIPIRVCRNGKWNPSIVECYPSCGHKTPKGTPTIVKGKNASRGDYPWQVGIYNTKKELICGGSIIDQHAILSAAHCLTDHNGNIRPRENYFIAAGKYYREYSDDRDELVQYSNVLAIHVPEKFKGGVHFYSYDIAVIILTDPFTFSEVVQPICIELNEEVQYVQLSLNDTALVTGWGQTKEGMDLSDVLKELIVPYIPYNKCYMEIPTNFRQYITFDKICGGYLNRGMSVCGGDSGGALSFKNIVNDRYYVIGIVSISPATTEVAACNSNTYSVYTGVSHHIKFVVDYLQYYKSEQSIECKSQEKCTDGEIENKNGCRFPNFPLNGNYIFLPQNNTLAPGDYVPVRSMLTLSCDIGYEASSSGATQSVCVDQGQWMPTLGTCKKMEPHDCFVVGEEGRGNCLSVYSCKPIMDYLQTLSVTSAAPIALKKYQCGIEEKVPKVCCYANKSISIETTDEELSFRPVNISNHKNINLLPKNCGEYSSQRNTIEFEMADLFEFPWMALLLYEQHINRPEKIKCEGTIITNRYVLTTAFCVKRKRPLKVRIGEYNIRSNPDCSIDGDNIFACADPVQDIAIEEVISHPNFSTSPSLNDVALLRLSEPMHFKRSVQPICLPIGEEFRIENFTNAELIITGWEYINNGKHGPHLSKANISILPETKCSYASEESISQNLCVNIVDKKFCGFKHGAPLQRAKVINHILRYVQFGMNSFASLFGCFDSSGLSITRIDYYRNWILDNLKI